MFFSLFEKLPPLFLYMSEMAGITQRQNKNEVEAVLRFLMGFWIL